MMVIAALAVGAALVVACQRETEKMVEVSGHLFVFNYRVATATYLVTLRKTAAVPDGAIAIAEFEDPAGGAPILLNEKVYPAWDQITLQSPPVHCIRKDKPYGVTIRLIDAGGKTLQELKTHLVSDVDQAAMLPSKPLVVGPFYDKNPDVFKSDGAVDYSNTDKCPAV
jgi:hypothetical protein